MLIKKNLKSKFCAKCGSKTESLIENLCAECYSNSNDIKVPKKREQKVCSKCSAVMVEHLWINFDKSVKDIFASQIKNAISVPENVRVVKVDLIKIKPDGLIEVTFELDGNVFSKEYTSNLNIKKQLCPVCKLRLNTNYNAKLQFRTKQNFQKFISESLEFIISYRKHITKIKESRRGIDVYLRSRNIALKMAHIFKQKFNCSMRESREEYSWNREKNKPKYKSTILLTKK